VIFYTKLPSYYYHTSDSNSDVVGQPGEALAPLEQPNILQCGISDVVQGFLGEKNLKASNHDISETFWGLMVHGD